MGVRKWSLHLHMASPHVLWKQFCNGLGWKRFQMAQGGSFDTIKKNKTKRLSRIAEEVGRGPFGASAPKCRHWRYVQQTPSLIGPCWPDIISIIVSQKKKSKFWFPIEACSGYLAFLHAAWQHFKRVGNRFQFIRETWPYIYEEDSMFRVKYSYMQWRMNSDALTYKLNWFRDLVCNPKHNSPLRWMEMPFICSEMHCTPAPVIFATSWLLQNNLPSCFYKAQQFCKLESLCREMKESRFSQQHNWIFSWIAQLTVIFCVCKLYVNPTFFFQSSCIIFFA